jgi:HK97 gp10 family phage protein
MAKVAGADKVRQRFTRMAASRTLTDRALYAAGQMIEIEAELSITRGSISGKGHVPSRPGEPPNADTRLLDTSIDTIVVGPNRVDVVSSAPYSAALEFGTSKMEARPFMGPAARAKQADAVDLIARAVKASAR